jgi:hypothetical protein
LRGKVTFRKSRMDRCRRCLGKPRRSRIDLHLSLLNLSRILAGSCVQEGFAVGGCVGGLKLEK